MLRTIIAAQSTDVDMKFIDKFRGRLFCFPGYHFKLSSSTITQPADHNYSSSGPWSLPSSKFPAPPPSPPPSSPSSSPRISPAIFRSSRAAAPNHSSSSSRSLKNRDQITAAAAVHSSRNSPHSTAAVVAYLRQASLVRSFFDVASKP